MSLTRYLLVMLIATLTSWGAFLLVVFNVDPYEGGVMGRALFLSTLFFALFGTISLAGFAIRAATRRDAPLYLQVIVSFRQAVLIALLIVAALVLQVLQVLTWWNSMIMLLCIIMIELFFLTRSSQRDI